MSTAENFFVRTHNQDEFLQLVGSIGTKPDDPTANHTTFPFFFQYCSHGFQLLLRMRPKPKPETVHSEARAIQKLHSCHNTDAPKPQNSVCIANDSCCYQQHETVPKKQVTARVTKQILSPCNVNDRAAPQRVAAGTT